MAKGQHHANGPSTSEINSGKKAHDPKYVGTHRQGTGMIPTGDRNRVIKEKGGNSDRI